VVIEGEGAKIVLGLNLIFFLRECFMFFKLTAKMNSKSEQREKEMEPHKCSCEEY